MTVDIRYDEALLSRIADAFDLREPNRQALAAVIRAIEAQDGPGEHVADLATGVGKTFLMAALIDYLAEQGVRNVLVITPGRVVQAKTIANFDEASPKHIRGADAAPVIVTPSTYTTQRADLMDDDRLKVLVFNIQQLLSDREGTNMGTRKHQEALGASLYGHLQSLDDLVVIADEHHLYHPDARKFSAAMRELGAIAIVGLTATPDPGDRDRLVFEYTLGEAIADGYVKRPVIVYRSGGTRDEQLQLRDAVDVLRIKQAAYEVESARRGTSVRPCLFVVASDVAHAHEVAALLADALGDERAVLTIVSNGDQEVLERLESVDRPDSGVQAIVSVNMLREGWDVKSIAVLVALRRLASQSLTEQVMGRGLRLPFGERTGSPLVDALDIIAHDSYEQLLAQKDVLAQRTMRAAVDVDVDRQGFADAPDVPRIPAMDGTDASSTTALAASVDEFELVSPTDDRARPSIVAVEVERRTTGPSVQLAGVNVGERIVFPRPERSAEPTPFELATIDDDDVRASARAHAARASASEVRRTELDARRGDDGTEIVARQVSNLEVTGVEAVSRELAERRLAAAVQRATPDLAQTTATFRRVQRIVATFLEAAGDEQHWTPQWLELASRDIGTLIRSEQAKAQAAVRWRVDLVPQAVPSRTVTWTGDEADAKRTDVAFERHRAYRGWEKHLLPVAAFDAGTTEFAIARILDGAPGIVRWLRLEHEDGVRITGGDGYASYYPDFIAIDRDDVHWLIEGKADATASDDAVQAKRRDARQWARRASDDERFAEWRYLFASERDVDGAHGSWEQLKSLADVG